MPDHGEKRPFAGDGGPPEKKMKGEQESSEIYSQRIKKKLQANSRTGQACDRCKERKMKCDAGPNGCQPCLSKNYRCMATDRITGQAMERGETARLKGDVERLTDQVTSYCHQFGPLPNRFGLPPYPSYNTPVDFHNRNPSVPDRTPSERPVMGGSVRRRPTGWNGPHRGPIHEATIDFIDAEIDIGDFPCPDMDDIMRISPTLSPLNNSRRSSLNTIHGAQKPDQPPLPKKEDAVQYIENWLKVIAPFVPVVHGPTIKRQVVEFYDNPSNFEGKPAVVAMITVILAIFSAQLAVRNPTTRQEKQAESNRLYHYSLSFFPELLLGDSLEDMQALALFLVHARNLPKPGNSWGLSSMILARAIELNYHRSSTQIVLPVEQQNPLAIELRKRVFWSIVGIQTSIAMKMSRPLAMKSADMDVELPLAVLDSELTEQGVLPRSGKCDWLGLIYLSKVLPLHMDLYENVVRVRKPEAEYLRDVEELDAELHRWHEEWTRETISQRGSGSSKIATQLIELWYAEFRIILHHPRLCTSPSPEVQQKNLDICLDASRVSLRNVRSMIKEFKGADFTWHFVSGYALAMGMAMHVYSKRLDRNTNQDMLSRLKLELMEWLFVMRSADYFMASGDHLYRFFHPRVLKLVDDAQSITTASEALRNGFPHNPPNQAIPTTYSSDNYPPPNTYSENNLATTTIPTGNLPTAAQHQQTYGTNPPQASTKSVTASTLSTDTGYHLKPETSYPDPTNYATGQQPHQSSDANAYPPQVQPSTAIYTSTGTGMAYLNAVTGGQEAFVADVEYGQAVWPLPIVQYQNGTM